MCLQTEAEDMKRRCSDDMLWQTVPHASCGDWKSSNTVGRLIVESDELTISVTMQTTDAFETPTLQGDGVYPQSRTELNREYI